MILSWLTATNNDGKLLMSINKRRNTAQALISAVASMNDKSAAGESSAVLFTLCVPTASMEDLVLAVGSTSGRTGSKFLSQQGDNNIIEKDEREYHVWKETAATAVSQMSPRLSKRQRKKMIQIMLSRGIPGLKRVPFGGEQDHGDSVTNDARSNSVRPFCIEGSVAHLLCRIDCVLPNMQDEVNGRSKQDESGGLHEQARWTGQTNNIDRQKNTIIDDEHYLISATVVDAYCRREYWDDKKCVFRPQDDSTKPYLTFLGSQTFGYVTTATVRS
jgi:hypothetical protein